MSMSTETALKRYRAAARDLDHYEAQAAKLTARVDPLIAKLNKAEARRNEARAKRDYHRDLLRARGENPDTEQATAKEAS